MHFPASLERAIPQLLQHCSFNQLKQIHGVLLASSLSYNTSLHSLFLRRTTEFGVNAMTYAHLAFVHSHVQSHVLVFNTMIRGYAYNGPFIQSLYLFDEMLHRNICPNYYTFTYLLLSCTQLGFFNYGRNVHCFLMKSGCEYSVRAKIFEFYMKVKGDKNNCLVDARRVFDEMSEKSIEQGNWLISEYVSINDLISARNLFDEMPVRDIVSWNAMISGYAKALDLTNLKELFRVMPLKNVISWTIMIRILAKKGDIRGAREVFDKMSERNTVSWNCMLSSYTQNGRYKEAIDLFLRMHSDRIFMDGYTFVAGLSACAYLGDLKLGRWIHHNLVKNVYKLGEIVATVLVEMYANCGDIDTAFLIFLKMSSKDIFSWNVIMKALAVHGRAEHAIKLFSEIKMKGIKPNEYTFMSVLFACNHGGLVDEGHRIFDEMCSLFNIEPKIEHYGCLIDLLCRNGRLEEAHKLVKEMPYEPDIAIWGALLSGCRFKNDLKSAEKIIEEIAETETDEGGVYALLSNMYANSGKYDEALKAREMLEKGSVSKVTGYSNVLATDRL